MVGKVVPPQKMGFLRKINFKSETGHFFHKGRKKKKLDLTSPIHGTSFELVGNLQKGLNFLFTFRFSYTCLVQLFENDLFESCDK